MNIKKQNKIKFIIKNSRFVFFALVLAGMLVFQFGFAVENKYALLPECAAGEGYICPATSPAGLQYNPNPTCRAPNFVWSGSEKEWKHVDKCSGKTGETCNAFSYEDLDWRNIFGKRWDLNDPSTPGSGMPDYTGLDVPYKKFNTISSTMQECNPAESSTYLGPPRSNYDPPCTRIPQDAVKEWAEYYKARYNQHKIAWLQCTKPVPDVPNLGDQIVKNTKQKVLLDLVEDSSQRFVSASCTGKFLLSATSRAKRYLKKSDTQSGRSASASLQRAYRAYRSMAIFGKRCGVKIDVREFRSLMSS